jgi:hypothetical protein
VPYCLMALVFALSFDQWVASPASVARPRRAAAIRAPDTPPRKLASGAAGARAALVLPKRHAQAAAMMLLRRERERERVCVLSSAVRFLLSSGSVVALVQRR